MALKHAAVAALLSVATAALSPLSAVHAQDRRLQVRPAAYPRLPRDADRPQSFTPAGWALEKLVTGDLNGDHLADAVLLLHQRDPRNLVKPPGGSEAVDTNPRILAVAFRGQDGRYHLVAENHTLVGRLTDLYLSDPMEEGGVEIRRGLLQVRVAYFSSLGGWTMYNSTFSLAWKGGRFVLVGYDRHALDRSDASSRDVSVNYLTGRVKLSANAGGEHAVTHTRWRQLRPAPLLSLDQIGNGLDYHGAGVPEL